MPDIALSVSVRRPRLSLKKPLSKPVAMRSERTAAPKVGSAAEDQRHAAAVPVREPRTGDMTELAMRLTMLRASSPASADASQEAANSVALPTCQAIAASALALARASQGSVLRLFGRSREFS